MRGGVVRTCHECTSQLPQNTLTKQKYLENKKKRLRGLKQIVHKINIGYIIINILMNFSIFMNVIYPFRIICSIWKYMWNLVLILKL